MEARTERGAPLLEQGVERSEEESELMEVSRAALNEAWERESGPEDIRCIPVRTPLIVPGDDYPAIYRNALEEAGIDLQAGDIVIAGEKAIAVAEGRSWHVDEIRPGLLARCLSRFVTKNPAGIGISIPQTFELAVREAGVFRILLAAALGALGKAAGVKGIFYRVAGRKVAMIDGPVPYAIPPYNKHCSLGPKDSGASARRLARILGVPVAVVDANDLGAEVVGVSSPEVSLPLVRAALADNPLGQEDQQTPFGILRKVVE